MALKLEQKLKTMKINTDRFRRIVLGISLFSSISAFAQTPVIDHTNVREGESVEYCTTHKKMKHLKETVPGFVQDFEALQAHLAQVEQEMLANPPAKRVIYKIPIVFHVLHNNGTENISDEQIMDAFAILNRDYRLLNSDALNVHNDFKASNPSATCTPADIEIEFVLATKAPNGACFNGITRTVSALTSDGSSGSAQVNAIVNGNNVYNGQWPPNKYLNIFIADEIGGAAGYTFNPGWSATNMYFNGIFMLHNYVGSIGTSSITGSRALTHEVGHWLNLSHTWGDDNNPGVACGSDQVNDTPETRGVTSCALNENFCGPRANVENYMDYSYCSKMFSEGQKARMRAALVATGTGRSNIWTAANLTAVGADGNMYLCTADFTVPKQTICAGESVTFNDASYNVVNGWTWSFPGGTPATSTEQNPTVVYSTPGTYAVTLTATDGSVSLTNNKTAYITVLPTGVNIPYHEGFEGFSQTSDMNWFSIVNSAPTSPSWSLTNTAGSTGTNSLKLANFTQTGTSYDEFISGPIDLSSITSATNVTMSFRYAYRKKASGNSEILKVLLTGDCGDTWQQRKTISGTSLSGVVATTAWTPTAADWTTVHMTNVTSQYWVENFSFKFRFDASGGNNVYLDDINIYPGSPSNDIVLGVNEINSVVEKLNVFPNPAEGELNISFNANNAKTVYLVVTDLLGKQIQQEMIQAASGSNLVLIPTDNIASGMYLLQIGDGTNKQVVQFQVK